MEDINKITEEVIDSSRPFIVFSRFLEFGNIPEDFSIVITTPLGERTLTKSNFTRLEAALCSFIDSQRECPEI